MASRILKFTSGASLNLQPVGAGERTTLHGYNITNTNAAARFVKIFWGNANNFSSNGDAPTVGTDKPLITIQIPAQSSVAQNYTSGPTGQGTMFVATTVNAADSDATTVGSGDLIVSLYYE